MQKQMETRFRLWPSWDYEQEQQWLDDRSGEGLQFEKAGLFWTRFSRDQSNRYTHRIDYQTDLRTKAQLQDYINLFADAGWEYKGSYLNMWRYFRRPWQSGAAPELYTDRTSLKQHYQRIQRLMGVALLANVPITVVNLNNLRLVPAGTVTTGIRLLVALEILLMALLTYGCLRMHRKIKSLSHGD